MYTNQHTWHVYVHVEHLDLFPYSVGIPIILTLSSLCYIELNLFTLLVSTAYLLIIINIVRREKTNKMQQLDVYY